MSGKPVKSHTADTAELVNTHFEENRKRQGLTCFDDQQVVDKSRKGGVDVRISTLVKNLNNPNGDFFTTSSCSGRAILFTHDAIDDLASSPSGETHSKSDAFLDASEHSSAAQTRKKGCQWLYVSHDEIQLDEFVKVWNELKPGTNAVFKMEPCILHVQCRNLSCTKKLVHLATEAGFRNSGMVIGKDNKITAAVRSAIGLEVPLRKEKKTEQPTVGLDYISYLVDTANEKLMENWKRTESFEQEFVKSYRVL